MSSANSLRIPEFLLEGLKAFRHKSAMKRQAGSGKAVFAELYASGKIPLEVAQQNLKLKDHGLGMLQDENGVVWQLENGVIYRVED